MTNTERTELELRNQMATMAQQIAMLTTHNDRLNKELPLMRKENRKLMGFIQDAHAYLRHSFRLATRQDIILSTLAHDLKGLANDDKCFVPRVSGYNDREQAL